MTTNFSFAKCFSKSSFGSAVPDILPFSSSKHPDTSPDEQDEVWSLYEDMFGSNEQQDSFAKHWIEESKSGTLLPLPCRRSQMPNEPLSDNMTNSKNSMEELHSVARKLGYLKRGGQGIVYLARLKKARKAAVSFFSTCCKNSELATENGTTCVSETPKVCTSSTFPLVAVKRSYTLNMDEYAHFGLCSIMLREPSIPKVLEYKFRSLMHDKLHLRAQESKREGVQSCFTSISNHFLELRKKIKTYPHCGVSSSLPSESSLDAYHTGVLASADQLSIAEKGLPVVTLSSCSAECVEGGTSASRADYSSSTLLHHHCPFLHVISTCRGPAQDAQTTTSQQGFLCPATANPDDLMLVLEYCPLELSFNGNACGSAICNTNSSEVSGNVFQMLVENTTALEEASGTTAPRASLCITTDLSVPQSAEMRFGSSGPTFDAFFDERERMLAAAQFGGVITRVQQCVVKYLLYHLLSSVATMHADAGNYLNNARHQSGSNGCTDGAAFCEWACQNQDFELKENGVDPQRLVVYHRDIKTSNILLNVIFVRREDGAPSECYPCLKLCDYGSARVVHFESEHDLLCHKNGHSASVPAHNQQLNRSGSIGGMSRGKKRMLLTPLARRTTLIYRSPESLVGGSYPFPSQMETDNASIFLRKGTSPSDSPPRSSEQNGNIEDTLPEDAASNSAQRGDLWATAMVFAELLLACENANFLANAQNNLLEYKHSPVSVGMGGQHLFMINQEGQDGFGCGAELQLFAMQMRLLGGAINSYKRFQDLTKNEQDTVLPDGHVLPACLKMALTNDFSNYKMLFRRFAHLVTPLGFDLLLQLLSSCQAPCTAEEALKHPYFTEDLTTQEGSVDVMQIAKSLLCKCAIAAVKDRLFSVQRRQDLRRDSNTSSFQRNGPIEMDTRSQSAQSFQTPGFPPELESLLRASPILRLSKFDEMGDESDDDIRDCSL